MSMRIRHHLYFHVARAVERALEKNLARAESLFAFGARRGQRRCEIIPALYAPHAASAAAVGRLDHQRIADALGFVG